MFSSYTHLLPFLPAVLANVDILNFDKRFRPLSSHGHRLSRQQPSLHLIIVPPISSVVDVDTTAWPDARSFTLRASWSAAHPFDVRIHLDEHGLAHLSAITYAVPVPGVPPPTSVPLAV